MRVLLDENLPEALLRALRSLGHEAESVDSLRLKGLDNGTLYREIAQSYDLFFTRDAAFVRSVGQLQTNTKVKLLRVVLPQARARQLASEFLASFAETEWTHYSNGSDWP